MPWSRLSDYRRHMCDEAAGVRRLVGEENRARQRSRTRSPVGLDEQISVSSGSGSSSGGTTYSVAPDSTRVMQVWQTPVRHDHRVGTSQTSASSSTEG